MRRSGPTMTRRRRRLLATLAMFALSIAPLGLPVDASAAPAAGVTEVEVERVRPEREKHPTLRFLKENRDFIRARFDLLQQKARSGRAGAEGIDPRFLAYSAMLESILAARDSVSSAEDALRRRDLLASITELGRLESDLDLMERLLGEQQDRLGIIQEDFTGEQETALVVVLSGAPASDAVTEIAITLEDGDTLRVPLAAEQRRALRQGGIVQVFHRPVEPRRQVLEIALAGEGANAGASGFVTLEPPRDRLTFLRLDLSGVGADRAAAGIRAATWLHDSRLPTRDG